MLLNSNIINLIANIFWIFGVFNVLINNRQTHWCHALWESLRGICVSRALQVNKGMFPEFWELMLPVGTHASSACSLTICYPGEGVCFFCPRTGNMRNCSLWCLQKIITDEEIQSLKLLKSSICCHWGCSRGSWDFYHSIFFFSLIFTVSFFFRVICACSL